MVSALFPEPVLEGDAHEQALQSVRAQGDRKGRGWLLRTSKTVYTVGFVVDLGGR